MDLKEVLKKCGELEDFPIVKIQRKLKHFPFQIGQIKQINNNGFSVDFGGEWNKWFWFEKRDDKRSTYTDELEFHDDSN